MYKSLGIVTLTLTVLLALAGCLAGGDTQIPSASRFRSPAIGTPMSARADVTQIKLPSNSSGVLFVNQMGGPVRVAVSETITTIPAEQSFLFVLPANVYQFYIYETGVSSKRRSERTEEGQIRYVYLVPLNKPQ